MAHIPLLQRVRKEILHAVVRVRKPVARCKVKVARRLLHIDIPKDVAALSLLRRDGVHKTLLRALHNVVSDHERPSLLAVRLAHVIARVATLESLRLCAVARATIVRFYIFCVARGLLLSLFALVLFLLSFSGLLLMLQEFARRLERPAQLVLLLVAQLLAKLSRRFLKMCDPHPLSGCCHCPPHRR